MKSFSYLCVSALVISLSSCFPEPNPVYRPQVPPRLPQANSPQYPTQPSLNRQQTKPLLKRLKNGHYTVLEDWPLTVRGRSFVIQKGYTCNGITAPTYIKRQLGDHINAPETWSAVFHDWLFTQKGITRQQADNYFVYLMQDYGINPTKVSLMGNYVKGYTILKEAKMR